MYLYLVENIQEQPNGKELDSRTKSEVAVGVTTRTSVLQGSSHCFNSLISAKFIEILRDEANHSSGMTIVIILVLIFIITISLPLLL